MNSGNSADISSSHGMNNNDSNELEGNFSVRYSNNSNGMNNNCNSNNTNTNSNNSNTNSNNNTKSNNNWGKRGSNVFRIDGMYLRRFFFMCLDALFVVVLFSMFVVFGMCLVCFFVFCVQENWMDLYLSQIGFVKKQGSHNAFAWTIMRFGRNIIKTTCLTLIYADNGV